MKTVGHWLLLFVLLTLMMLGVTNHAYKIGLRDGRESVQPAPQPKLEDQCMNWWFDGKRSLVQIRKQMCRGKA